MSDQIKTYRGSQLYEIIHKNSDEAAREYVTKADHAAALAKAVADAVAKVRREEVNP